MYVVWMALMKCNLAVLYGRGWTLPFGSMSECGSPTSNNDKQLSFLPEAAAFLSCPLKRFQTICFVSYSNSSLYMSQTILQTMPPDREVGGPGGPGVSPIDLPCLPQFLNLTMYSR